MKIKLAKINQKNDIFKVYENCKKRLEAENIYQWNENYPTLEIIENDILSSYLYILTDEKEIIGAINLSSIQEKEYDNVNWSCKSENVLVIHRLAVEPKYQNLGYAKILMDFAEKYALENKFNAIRLDAFSGNERILRFYEQRNYLKQGEIFFPERDLPFYCYEKQIVEK